MTAIFLSDIHLLDATSVKTLLFTKFLEEKASQFDNIYILGDLFDVWPGTTRFLITHFNSVLQVLKKLSSQGHNVKYVEGNHDFCLGKYFKEELKMTVYTETVVENWGDKKVYLAHGDLGNPDQKAYRVLRKLLRSTITQAAMRLVPGELVFKVGVKTSQVSRSYENPDHQESVRKIYRSFSENLFHQGVDVVIMGHTHIPDDYQVNIGGRNCRYLNSGDWVKSFTYLEFSGSQFYTKKHPIKDT